MQLSYKCLVHVKRLDTLNRKNLFITVIRIGVPAIMVEGLTTILLNRRMRDMVIFPSTIEHR